jgi:hypothetical protein
MPLRKVAIHRDGLIANHARASVCRRRVHPVGIQIRLRAGDEEGAGLMQHMQAGEIHVAAVHHVDGASFGKQHIECMDIMQLAVGYVDEAWNVASQIEEGVHLHRGLGRTKMRPWEYRQA